MSRKKTDQQENLMAFAQVVQNEAPLELEPVYLCLVVEDVKHKSLLVS